MGKSKTIQIGFWEGSPKKPSYTRILQWLQQALEIVLSRCHAGTMPCRHVTTKPCFSKTTMQKTPPFLQEALFDCRTIHLSSYQFFISENRLKKRRKKRRCKKRLKKRLKKRRKKRPCFKIASKNDPKTTLFQKRLKNRPKKSNKRSVLLFWQQ